MSLPPTATPVTRVASMAVTVAGSSTNEPKSVERGIGSKTTSVGTWEEREGKFFRSDYYAVAPGEQIKQTIKLKCPACPKREDRMIVLIRERDELRRLLTEKESRLSDFEKRFGPSQPTQIVQDSPQKMLSGLSTEQQFSETVSTREDTQFLLPSRWYYAVMNPQHAQMLQKEATYVGGDIVVDSLEGATVVNPEYYNQSERVAGSSRLRIRVVSAQLPGQQSSAGNQELFVRMRIAGATQYTQARPAAQTLSWNQDFVFTGVPTKNLPSNAAQVPAHPLLVEIVSRVMGTAAETVLGSSSVNMDDIVQNLTRHHVLLLDNGGIVNLRVKALDFGLPTTAQQVIQSAGTVTTQTTHTHVTTVQMPQGGVYAASPSPSPAPIFSSSPSPSPVPMMMMPPSPSRSPSPTPGPSPAPVMQNSYGYFTTQDSRNLRVLSTPVPGYMPPMNNLTGMTASMWRSATPAGFGFTGR